MNNLALNFHTARQVRARRVCINGRWQLSLTVDLEDDAQAILTFFADTREALDVIWGDDDHCRITHDSEARIEHSAVPFTNKEQPNGTP